MTNIESSVSYVVKVPVRMTAGLADVNSTTIADENMI